MTITEDNTTQHNSAYHWQSTMSSAASCAGLLYPVAACKEGVLLAVLVLGIPQNLAVRILISQESQRVDSFNQNSP